MTVNYLFLIEREEENGCVNLQSFIEKHKGQLSSVLVYTFDGPMLSDGSPYLLLGVIGLLYVEMNARTAAFDNHSGNKGNIASNPAWELIQLLNTLRDEDEIERASGRE